MPFPLAHPAAVLPLRRYCPRWLNFPALVIGSLTPDAGYLFGEEHMGAVSHRFVGSAAFCLPVGAVLLLAFYRLRLPLVKMLPDPHRQSLLLLCQRPAGALWAMIVSLLIGAWTHILLDSFTHNGGWFVQHLPVLQMPILSVAGRTARLCHLLWYILSFAGVVWLVIAFERWKRTRAGEGTTVPRKEVWRNAVLVAIWVLPIELAHHLVAHNRLGLLLVAALCALPVAGIVLKVSNAPES